MTERDEEKPCCRCAWWKRRGEVVGVCWFRSDQYPRLEALTLEHLTCAEWTQKVVKR